MVKTRTRASIAELIDRTGLTVPQVANELRAAESLIYHWRRGLHVPPVYRRAELAKVLNVSLGVLERAIEETAAQRAAR